MISILAIGWPMIEIPPSCLESLLKLALRTSLVDSDPYKDNLRPLLVPYDLITQLFYIMAIQPEGWARTPIPPGSILRPYPDTVNLTGRQLVAENQAALAFGESVEQAHRGGVAQDAGMAIGVASR